MKDTLKTKPSSDISPIHDVSGKVEQFVAVSDLDKVELLNIFFSSVCDICDTGHVLPSCTRSAIINNQISLLMKRYD